MTATGLAVAGLVLLIVAALAWRNGIGFIETSRMDAVSVGVDRMQNFELMKCQIESGEVAEA